MGRDYTNPAPLLQREPFCAIINLQNSFVVMEEKFQKNLQSFFEFVGANVEESEKDYGNSLIRQMQRTIRGIKTDREVGEIPEELRKEIEEIDNLDFLKTLHKKAARTESVETFETELKKLFEAVEEKQ